MEEYIQRNRTIEEVKMMSPLIWAYIGDAVYELSIRTHLINERKSKPHKLHIESIQYVKAKAQADLLASLQEELTEEEKDIVRRGRNTDTHHIAKNASVEEYRYATAFEALIGYLYLTKQDERLEKILKRCIEIKQEVC